MIVSFVSHLFYSLEYPESIDSKQRALSSGASALVAENVVGLAMERELKWEMSEWTIEVMVT